MNEKVKDKRIIVSVSGGKDSTAMCLHLLENGYTINDFDRIFFDTGWENIRTYEYLDKLEKTIGPITRIKQHVEIYEGYEEHIAHFEKRLGFESPFVRTVFKKLMFPRRLVKWCTTALKVKPAKEYFLNLEYDYINLVGIRRQESKRRAAMPEFEWSESFDCWIWRPLIDWSEKDVIDIHHRFGLIPNPLYLEGSHRVGCWPCIMSRKKEFGNLDEDRIELIHDLEILITELRKERFPDIELPATFFQARNKDDQYPIKRVIEWSKTSRGGKQFELFATDEPTCVKWGLCNV